MRQRGPRATVGGLGRHDHGCLVHGDDATFAEAAVTYLHDGLCLGQRMMFTGTAPEVLDGLGDVEALQDTGVLEVLDTSNRHDVLDADQLEDDYGAAITRALEDGYTGLRVFAEVPATATAEQLIRWEARADRMIAERPWTAMCAYDDRRFPQGVLADVATVHPLVCGGGAERTPFKLVGTACDGLALTGCVDTFYATDLERRLRAAAPDGSYRLDLGELEFADHAAVLALARVRGETGLTCTDAPRIVNRLADLLEVTL